MAYVYILKSTVDGVTYTGSTSDIERRLKENNDGKNVFTSRHHPWRLVYKETFKELREARKRENT